MPTSLIRPRKPYYREDLRQDHLKQAYSIIQSDLTRIDNSSTTSDFACREMLNDIMQEKSVQAFAKAVETDVFADRLGRQPLKRLLNLLLLIEYWDRQQLAGENPLIQEYYGTDPSIYRPDQRACL